MSRFIEVWTNPKRFINGMKGLVPLTKLSVLVAAWIVSAIIAISAELINEALGMNEQQNTNEATVTADATRTNIKGIGSNAGRLYTHTDTKLLKNGGGSAW